MFYTQENTRGEPFYKLPQILFKDEKYKKLSSDAKILYAIMQNRVTLSEDNRWVDDDDRVFIYLTIEEVMNLVNCKDQKAQKIINELREIQLINVARQGLNKPNKIYVKMLTSENHYSGLVKITNHDKCKSLTSNNEYSKTDISKNNYLSKAKALDQKTLFQIPLKDGSLYNLNNKDIEFYKELYPNINIEQEIKNIIGWNMANNNRRKTKKGIKKHINSWLSKANIGKNEIIKLECRKNNGTAKKQDNEIKEFKNRIDRFTTVL